jgi:YidC/Oxa1 family membrane protein insertase
MQDQGKRLLLAVALALGVMMIWQVMFPGEKPKPKPATDGSGSAAEVVPANNGFDDEVKPPAPPATGSGSAAGVGSGPGSGSATAEAPATAPVPAVLEGYGIRIKFASSWAISRVPAAAKGKPDQLVVSHSDDNKTAKTLTVIPAPVKGATVPPIRVPDHTGFSCGPPDPANPALGGPRTATAPQINPPIATAPPAPPEPCKGTQQTFAFDKVSIATSTCGGAITSWQLLAKKYEREPRKGQMIHPQGKGALLVNFDKNSTVVIPAEAEWTASNITADGITYTWDSPDIRVVKQLTFLPDDFLIKTKLTFEGKTAKAARQILKVTSYGFQDPKQSTAHARGNIEWKAACLRGEDVHVSSYKTLLAEPNGRGENGVQWAGFAEGYVPGSRFTAAQAGQFLNVTAPNPRANDLIACNGYASPAVAGLMRVDLVFPEMTLQADGTTSTREMATYIGPTSYEVLEAADAKVGFSTGFKEVPDFGWFGVIGRPLLWILHKLYELVSNWGLAIVLLTCLVKGATLIFTTRSMRSMKAMAALAPKMKELQEKHKDDRARLQQETMGLYKQYGVNPLAGCLPMLLQMPIWIALYRMLSSAGELYLEPLIPGWIVDLTSPDPYHILPVVLIATMFLQSKLQPQTQTGLQAKILMYGLPLMFGVASFFFPSGLSLYIVTNALLSAAHSVWMNKYDKKGPAMVAAIARQASGGGGGGGGGGKGGEPKAGKAKPAVIEVEDRSTALATAPRDTRAADSSTERDDDDDGDGDAPDEAPASSEAGVAAAGPRARRPGRPRRKRRGRN